MHQFMIAPIGSDQLAATPFQFTNSALWMIIVLVAILVFMWGGTKRELVPGRWQAAVEMLTGFLDNVTRQNIGPEGRKYLPWVFTAFVFILAANWIGAMPFAIVPGAHPFTVTSQFTVTGTMSIISFAIVLGVGFWKHGLHFFSLFVPHGTPLPLKFIVAPIEFVSFLVRPFSLGLRPFIAMFAGHILLEVFGNFVVQGLNAGGPMGYGISLLAFVFVVFVNALELLVGAIQAFVFALLTALYINDAVNLH
ncbi:F0F1 ATP synthase subunit A [Tsuneonella sp. YG55]|uniref:ATP synthase subunit a n=1 Tax=Tsuneonella litorea TaxID=2976475 RepID=A0A9X2W304_9SPHN|nr:F0F1 ATP synthase subunit A [Tsuneonella litorea]MCT2558866.1 F0F1 ATP synthase subunit A [Tsuneonella litorea]